MVNMAIRRKLLATTIIAGTLLSAPAFAQTATPAAPAEATAAESDTIVVTGSLISNPNLERAAPVNVTTAEEIELQSANVAEEILREIPGVVPSIGSAVNNGNGGASYVNLRGLGSNRNIVLLDSNRIAPADLLGRTDLNNIPLALVERVDVLTGGASTTYGADAISGVVNFITKRDFAGAEFQLSEQITEQGDGNQLRVDATIGANFDDGRGNAVFSMGYQESDPVYQGARDVSLTTIETFGGTALGSGTAFPSRFSGTRLPGSVGVPTPNSGNGATNQINDAGQIVPTFSTFNFNPFNVFQTPFQRYNMFGQARYEISDAIEVYARGLFSKNTVNTIIAPSGAFGIGVNISLNNPFLPTAARNQFCAFDVNPSTTVYTPRFTQAVCDAAANGALRPGQADYREVGTGGFTAFDVNGNGTIEAGEGFNPNPQSLLSRRAIEAGPRISEYVTTIFDYRIGFRGGITDSINWDVSGAYGESQNNQTIQGYFTNSRVRQSLLAGGTAAAPVCFNAANGCVPGNFFGTISPQAVGFIIQESSSFVRSTLAQAKGTITGDLGFSSPFADDAISFAVGAEYRKYQSRQGSDTLAHSGDLGGAGGATPNIRGGYDVYEAVGELAIPLVQDKPFFKSLTIEGGVRYSKYRVEAPTSPSYETTTYKVGGSWEPTDGFTVRGTYARAVRAPNISELFSPVNTGLTNLGVDPCATNLTSGATIPGRPAGGPTGELRAVCLAQGATLGSINSIPQPNAGQVNATGGGNLNVRPETSDSFTVGAIFQPSFVPGFTLSVDYYNIKIKDAITAPTPADVIAACFGRDVFNPAAGSSTNPACTTIRRSPADGGLSGDPNAFSGLPSTISNRGALLTDGIDLILNYRTDITDNVRLALNFNGNYTFRSKFNAFVASPVSVNRDCTGFISSNCGSIQPQFQWSQRTTLSFGEDIDLSLLWRHIDAIVQEPLDANPVGGSGPFFNGTVLATIPGVGGRTVNFGKIAPYDYFDLAARIGVMDNLVLTLTVQNLLDKGPPLTGNNAGSTTFNSGNTFPSTYDSIGRRYGAALRLKF